jgi:hypothetical protein
MKEKVYAGGITDEWLVDDVLQRYSLIKSSRDSGIGLALGEYVRRTM